MASKGFFSDLGCASSFLTSRTCHSVIPSWRAIVFAPKLSFKSFSMIVFIIIFLSFPL